jgi:hypothetical protein
MQICRDYYVLIDKNEIVLLNKNSGWVCKRFKFDGKDFLLNQETNSILTYKNESKQVVSYNLDGKSQTHDTNIPNASYQLKLVDCVNEKLLFLDSETNCLYF